MRRDDLQSLPGAGMGRLAAGWLVLGVASLLVAGLLSVLLVLARTPWIAARMPWVDFFHVALVVHVDLSVLIWFLAFAGVIWSLCSCGRFPVLGWTGLGIASLGTLIIACSPFLGAGNPLMNNYVPVLDHPLFLWGILLFFVGTGLQVAHALLTIRPFAELPGNTMPFKAKNNNETRGSLKVVKYGAWVSALMTALAYISFLWSYISIPSGFAGTIYYELLFWGGGHLLQFVHTTLMIVVWLWLASIAAVQYRLSSFTAMALLSLMPFAALSAPFVYLMFPVASAEHLQSFTHLMEFGMGLAPVMVGGILVIGLLQSPASAEYPHLRAALVSSLVLFAAGGVIGYLIRGINVTIPSHYHGVIVGVTLAFMGLTYYLLPVLGFKKPKAGLAAVQEYVYGGGQLLFVIGMAWAGGYGVQRKLPGAAQGLDTVKKILGMTLMGAGGMIAVAGGFLFLVIALRSLWPSKAEKGYN